jgi:tetratricopeptide (TPR) repeat protein/mono/diheme cytochrome c family protein
MKRLVCLVAILTLSPLAVPFPADQRALAALDAPPTFAKDIAPIVYSQCAPCHRPDGTAPFSLLTYGEARRRGRDMVRVTKSRFMPPWKPEAGFGDFAGERRLTDAQILTIDRWVNTGLREGQASDLPPMPRWSRGWQLGEPDLVITLPEYTLGADGSDVFRNFVVRVPGAGTRYVRGLEFRPGSAAVHHANIRIDETAASRRLDEADPEPGYEGAILHSADYPDGHFLGWTPGQAPPLAPNDMAWRLESGSDLVVQLHLKPTGKPERMQPAIGVYFAAAPPAQTPAILRLGRQNLDMPPGVRDYRVVDSYVLPVDAEIRAIQPHAHYRALIVSAWATLPGGARRPLILIRHWDFNWQDQYRYATPFWLPAGTMIEMEYVFDNSGDNPRNPSRPPARVSWGWRASDEMADVWIQVMTRSEPDRAQLVRDVRRKMALEDVIGCETLIARQPDYADLRNDAAALYSEIGQPEAALRHFEVVLRLQPESAVAHYNVGVALEALRRSDEAAREYEGAVRIDPAYSLAHNNLGTLHFAQGRLGDARREYERATQYGPTNAEAHNNLGAVLLAFDDPVGSIPYLQQAIRLRPTYPEAHFNLARAYASTRQIDEAIRAATIAEEQAIAAGKSELTGKIREQLRLYRAGARR